MGIRKNAGLWKRLLLVLCAGLLVVNLILVGHYIVLPRWRASRNAASAPVAEGMSGSDRARLEEKTLAESSAAANLVPGAAAAGNACPVSFFLTDLQKVDPAETIAMMNACQVSALSVPLVWSDLEKTEGMFDPSAYDALLAPYVDAGFRFIFLLDGAGRLITDGNGQIIGNSLPEWAAEKEGITRQMDFLDRIDAGYGLSYANPANQALYLRFCEQAVAWFGERYAGHLAGFAPCIMNEFEMKYPQTLYAWTDFSIGALAGFRDFLRGIYGTAAEMNARLGTAYAGFSSVSLPVISYNNTLASGELKDDPLFPDYQRYREQALVEYVTPVFETIRNAGYTAVAYFAQVLSGQDGIYASGTVTRLASLADIAVIDFNFYDGYGEVYDSIIPAMMVNYVKNAGYAQVWAGLYFERIPYLEHMDLLQEAVDYVAADGLADGFEIGGIIDAFRAKGQEARPDLTYGVTDRTAQPRIAVYAGEWTFYKDHGEQVRYFNFFSDALAQMYKIIRFELNEPVDILCDAAMLSGAAGKYSLLVLPSQFYVEPDLRQAVEAYLAEGGRVLTDFRFGEWNADGTNTGEWSDAAFGLGNKQALCVAEQKLTAAADSPVAGCADIIVRGYYPAVPDLYAITPGNGAKSLFRDASGRTYGCWTKNTVVLGFQPQLLYKYAEDASERTAAADIIRAAVKYLLSGQ